MTDFGPSSPHPGDGQVACFIKVIVVAACFFLTHCCCRAQASCEVYGRTVAGGGVAQLVARRAHNPNVVNSLARGVVVHHTFGLCGVLCFLFACVPFVFGPCDR